MKVTKLFLLFCIVLVASCLPEYMHTSEELISFPYLLAIFSNNIIMVTVHTIVEESYVIVPDITNSINNDVGGEAIPSSGTNLLVCTSVLNGHDCII